MKPIKVLVAISTLALLAGCAEQNLSSAESTLEKRKAECDAQYHGPHHYLDWVNCTASARSAVHRAQGMPEDLDALVAVNLAELAGEYDAGRITFQQAELKRTTPSMP